MTSHPPGRSQARASSTTRAGTSRPVGPETVATRGSWSRTSAASPTSCAAARYGGFAATRSTAPRRVAGRGESRSPSRTVTLPAPIRSRLRRAQVAASALTSVAHTVASGRSTPMDRAMAPEPVPTSTTTGDATPASRPSACSTSISVSGRGTSTPGPTARSSRRNTWWPVRYWRGSPSTRRVTRPPSLAAASAESRGPLPYSSARVSPSTWVMRISASACGLSTAAPRQRRAHRRASRASLGGEVLRTLLLDQGVDETVELPGEDRRKLVERHLDPVVGDAVLLEVVRPDLLRAVDVGDLAAAGGDEVRLAAFLFLLEEPGTQQPHRFLPVLELRALLLARDNQPGGLVGDPHRRVGRVHGLTARAAGVVHVGLQVPRIDLHVELLGLRQHQHAGGGRVDTALGLGVGNALDPVHAGLVLEAGVGPLALDLEGDVFESPHVRGLGRQDLGLPATALGVALVHAEGVAGKQRRLLAALPGLDLDDHALVVVGVLRQQQDAQLALEAGRQGQLGVVFRLRQRLHLLVRPFLGHLAGRGRLGKRLPVAAVLED